jgi:hypothetical protein
VETRRVEDLAKALKKNAEEKSEVEELISKKRKADEVEDLPNKRIKADSTVIRGRERLDLLGIRRTKPGMKQILIE